MPFIFFLTFSLIFSLIAWKNFRLAVQILIVLLPTYLVRFKIGPLPSTLLETAFLITFAFWTVLYLRFDWLKIRTFFQNNKYFTVFFTTFFIASVISIFVSDMWWYSFGQWRAYFLEPMILFLILIGRRDHILTDDLIWALGLSTVSIALFGIIQKFTGWLLPTDEWRNISTRRVTSFFTSPNAVGLYLGPVLLLMSSKIALACRPATVETVASNNFSKIRSFLRSLTNFKIEMGDKKIYWYLVFFVFSAWAIFFTRSLGTWVALFVGLVLFLFLVKQKILAGTLVFFAIVPLLFPPVQNFISSKNRSTDNRFQLWNYSSEFLSASPKNFVFGTGVRQFFRKVQKPHYDQEELERLIYPHNILLNFWTEIGLFGMISFIGMYFLLFKESYKVYRKEMFLGAGFLAMLTAILVHGLIDVPYFKNDLSMLFWIISALIFSVKTSEV